MDRRRLPTLIETLRESVPQRRLEDRIGRMCIVVAFALYAGGVALFIAHGVGVIV